jgi:hypothetical protein
LYSLRVHLGEWNQINKINHINVHMDKDRKFL